MIAPAEDRMTKQSASIVVTLNEDQSLNIDINYLPEGGDPSNIAWRLVKSLEQAINEIVNEQGETQE